LSGSSPKRQPTRFFANTRHHRSDGLRQLSTLAITEATVCANCQDLGCRSGVDPSGVANDFPTSWEGSPAAGADPGQGPELVADGVELGPPKWVASTANESPTNGG